MDKVMNNVGPFTLLVLFLIGNTYGQDVCVKKSACSCEFSNGTGIDLSQTVSTDFYTTQNFEIKNNDSQYLFHTFYFHPCFDALPKVNASAGDNTCNKPLSLCNQVETLDLNITTKTFTKDGGRNEFLGSVNKTTFTADGSSIIYDNSPSSTVVLLVCSQNDKSNLQVVSIEDHNKMVLAFYSRDACLKQLEEVGRSMGSTLLIILFSCATFYLVVGVLARRFLMGATGLEVIPNLPFWMDLPNLVRDGWAFARNGFKLPPRGAGPVASPDPNSYDSI